MGFPCALRFLRLHSRRAARLDHETSKAKVDRTRRLRQSERLCQAQPDCSCQASSLESQFAGSERGNSTLANLGLRSNNSSCSCQATCKSCLGSCSALGMEEWECSSPTCLFCQAGQCRKPNPAMSSEVKQIQAQNSKTRPIYEALPMSCEARTCSPW